MGTRSTRQSLSILIIVASGMALQMTAFSMLVPIFARRFDSLGAGVQALAVSEMAYALTATVAAPFAGMLADRFGRRPIILVSLAGCALAFGGFVAAPSAWLLILLRGLSGVFSAGLLPAVMGIVGDLAPENRRGQWTGIVSGGAAAGWIAGPLAGGLLYDRFGCSAPFLAATVMVAGTLVLAVFGIRERRGTAPQVGRRRPIWMPDWRAVPARSTLFLLLLVAFGVAFAWMFIGPQFPFYMYDSLKWTSSQLGLAMSTYSVAYMLGALALGRLSDRLGRKPVLVVGLALFSAQFAGLAIFREAGWIVMSFVVAGLGNALYDPALNAMILDITPAEHTAGVMGLKCMAASVANLLGPALVVLLAPLVGPQGVFLISAVLVWLLALTTGLALPLTSVPHASRPYAPSVRGHHSPVRHS
jgi:MFS family permease